MMDAIKDAIQIEKSPVMPLPQKDIVGPHEEHEEMHVMEGTMLNDDELLDEALELTFPASDPIAIHEHSKFTRPAVSRHEH